jgi:hypothetical protein
MIFFEKCWLWTSRSILAVANRTPLESNISTVSLLAEIIQSRQVNVSSSVHLAWSWRFCSHTCTSRTRSESNHSSCPALQSDRGWRIPLLGLRNSGNGCCSLWKHLFTPLASQLTKRSLSDAFRRNRWAGSLVLLLRVRRRQGVNLVRVLKQHPDRQCTHAPKPPSIAGIVSMWRFGYSTISGTTFLCWRTSIPHCLTSQLGKILGTHQERVAISGTRAIYEGTALEQDVHRAVDSFVDFMLETWRETEDLACYIP